MDLHKYNTLDSHSVGKIFLLSLMSLLEIRVSECMSVSIRLKIAVNPVG